MISGPNPCLATMKATVRKRARSRMATPTIEGVSLGLVHGDLLLPARCAAARANRRLCAINGDGARSASGQMQVTMLSARTVGGLPSRDAAGCMSALTPGDRQQLLGLRRLPTALLRAQAFGQASQRPAVLRIALQLLAIDLLGIAPAGRLPALPRPATAGPANASRAARRRECESSMATASVSAVMAAAWSPRASASSA